MMTHKGGPNNGIYDANYHPAKFIELSKLGWTKAQIASEFDVSRMGMWKWRENYPEFAEAVSKGEMHAQAFAERILDKIAQGEIENANATAQIFKMKAQFQEDYAERKFITTDSTFTINALPDDQLHKQIAAKFKLLSAQERSELLSQSGALIEGEVLDSLTEEIAPNEYKE